MDEPKGIGAFFHGDDQPRNVLPRQDNPGYGESLVEKQQKKNIEKTERGRLQ